MIKAGDLVQLKTGGCLMTVERTDDGATYNYVYCIWFDDVGELRKNTFHKNSLRKLEVVEENLCA